VTAEKATSPAMYAHESTISSVHSELVGHEGERSLRLRRRLRPLRQVSGEARQIRGDLRAARSHVLGRKDGIRKPLGRVRSQPLDRGGGRRQRSLRTPP
jgi:hypothetical protein